jgi:hypothetical protein
MLVEVAVFPAATVTNALPLKTHWPRPDNG